MEWINTANELVSLLMAFIGLLTTGISVFALVKNLIASSKEKSFQENWKLIMKIADTAMIEAEKSAAKGETKKEMVINIVKEGCKTAGINVDAFIDQLSAYIDDCIRFANNLNK